MIKYDDFYKQFTTNEQDKLKRYFKKLNEKIALSKKEEKLFNEDFEKAISYYYEKKYDLAQILNILDISNLGKCYKDVPNYWYPLDNAAKIYPLSMRESWMSVFRISCYLKEDIVPEILQIALLFTMKRFPTFRTSIRTGFFWNYIDGIKKRFHVYEDKMLPCSYINVSNIGKQSFKVVYYKKRISVEYFHILTDGHGAKIFLLTLISVYLKLLGSNIEFNDNVLDVNKKYLKYEVEDEFITKEKAHKTGTLVDTKALQLNGKLSIIKPCQILHFDMNIDDLKKIAKEKKVTITELLVGFTFLSLASNTSKEGYIKLQLPVNMRNYYPSKTLRNFALYIVISIKKEEIKTLDGVLKEIKKQVKEKNNKQRLDELMTYTNKLVKYLRFVPLIIKKPLASIAYGFLGDRVITTVLSNLGNVSLPSEIEKHIEKMDFVLGSGIISRVLLGVVTCNKVLTFTISKATIDSSFEDSLYKMFNDNKINVKVHGSEIYENRK